jgi:hypothetical protein
MERNLTEVLKSAFMSANRHKTDLFVVFKFEDIKPVFEMYSTDYGFKLKLERAMSECKISDGEVEKLKNLFSAEMPDVKTKYHEAEDYVAVDREKIYMLTNW